MINAIPKASVKLVQLIGRVRRVQLGGMQNNRFGARACAQLVETGSNRSCMDIVLIVTFATLEDRNIAKPSPICAEYEPNLTYLRFFRFSVGVRRGSRSDVFLLSLVWPRRRPPCIDHCRAVNMDTCLGLLEKTLYRSRQKVLSFPDLNSITRPNWLSHDRIDSN